MVINHCVQVCHCVISIAASKNILPAGTGSTRCTLTRWCTSSLHFITVRLEQAATQLFKYSSLLFDASFYVIWLVLLLDLSVLVQFEIHFLYFVTGLFHTYASHYWICIKIEMWQFHAMPLSIQNGRLLRSLLVSAFLKTAHANHSTLKAALPRVLSNIPTCVVPVPCLFGMGRLLCSLLEKAAHPKKNSQLTLHFVGTSAIHVPRSSYFPFTVLIRY